MSVKFKPDKSGKQKREAAGKTAAALMFVHAAETSLDTFDATTLAEHAALFDFHTRGIAYKAGQIRLDAADGGLYRCTTDHPASKSKRSPLKDPDQWALICLPADPWPQWYPYIGRTDAWMQGDRCSHAGKRWVCQKDYAVQEPGSGDAWVEEYMAQSSGGDAGGDAGSGGLLPAT